MSGSSYSRCSSQPRIAVANRSMCVPRSPCWSSTAVITLARQTVKKRPRQRATECLTVQTLVEHQVDGAIDLLDQVLQAAPKRRLSLGHNSTANVRPQAASWNRRVADKTLLLVE